MEALDLPNKSSEFASLEKLIENKCVRKPLTLSMIIDPLEIRYDVNLQFYKIGTLNATSVHPNMLLTFNKKTGKCFSQQLPLPHSSVAIPLSHSSVAIPFFDTPEQKASVSFASSMFAQLVSLQSEAEIEESLQSEAEIEIVEGAMSSSESAVNPAVLDPDLVESESGNIFLE